MVVQQRNHAIWIHVFADKKWTILKILLIFYVLYWVFIAMLRVYSSSWWAGFSLQWLLLLLSMGCRCSGFSSCSLQGLELLLSSCGMWDLPGPGIEPASLALAGRFLTTVPPGKSQELISFEVSKDALDLFCSSCHIKGFTFSGLCSSCFPLVDFIFDVLLVGFFHKGGLLQVMVHDNSNMSDYCALLSLPSLQWKHFHQWVVHWCYPLSCWSPSPHLQTQPSVTSQSCRCWRTSHEGWCGPSRWSWWQLERHDFGASFLGAWSSE